MFGAFFSFIVGNILYFALHLENSSFPKPLTAKEEAKAFDEMKNGVQQARERLIQHNLRLVAHIAKKYYHSNLEQDDLISIGTIGLMKAISTFNHEKGARFATYAARCIENEILMQFRTSKKYAKDISLNDPIENDIEGNALTLNDVMADSFDLREYCEKQQEVEKLYRVVDSLSGRERQVVILRYGLYGKKPLTQNETAEILNISRSYVSRIEKKTLAMLRQSLQKIQ